VLLQSYRLFVIPPQLTRLSSASPPDTGQPGAIAFPEYNGLGSDDYECPRENFCL